MLRSRQKLPTLVLGLFLALALAALANLSFQRKIESFRTLGFDADLAGGAWRVSAVEDRASALRPADQIVLVNGLEASSIDDLRRVLHAQPTSKLVVERAGGLTEVAFSRPALAIDWSYLVLATIGILYLLIGLFTLLKNRERAGILFFGWSLLYATFFLLSTTGVYDRLDRLFYTLDEMARLILPPLTVHFFLLFPAPLGKSERGRRLSAFLYLPAAVLLALQLDLVLANGSVLLGAIDQAALGRAILALQNLDLYHFVLFSLVAAGILGYRMLVEPRWEERRQLQWLVLGMGGGYLPFLAYLVFQRLGGQNVVRSATWIEVLAVLPLALVPLAFAGSILRYKLWDIEIVVRDTIAYTGTALLALLGFSLVNLGVSRGLPAELGAARNLISFSAGLLVAAFVTPMRRQIATTLERFQYRSGFAPRRSLRDLASQLLHERHLPDLCRHLLDNLEEALGLEKANVYLSQGGQLVPARSEPGVPARLSFGAFEPDLWQREVAGVSSFALPLEAETETNQLFQAGYRYAFPLMVRESRVGVALVSYKDEGRPLSSEDQDLIRSVLDQAALAIENAQLLEQVQRQLLEVGRLQRFSHGIIEASPAATVVIDAADQVVEANRAFAELAGKTVTQLVGAAFESLLPIRPLPEPGQGLIEISYCEPGGDERHLHVRVAHFRPEEGKSLRVVVIHDVSERVALENALKEKDRLASLGMLAAGVAHEVNTPITGISSYAQMLLADTPEGDPRREVLQKIEAQTFRAARIVNNLLEFARQRRSERRPVAIGRLLEDTFDLLKDRFSKSRVNLVFTPPADELAVFGSDGELQQVFTNLAVNACDAMADSGGTFTVSLEVDSEQVAVVLADDGPGIPTERLERVFQPFFSTKLNRGGTGLGLSISYDIVRRHNGTLTVSSQPGQGTRFTVRLPRHRLEPRLSA